MRMTRTAVSIASLALAAMAVAQDPPAAPPSGEPTPRQGNGAPEGGSRGGREGGPGEGRQRGPRGGAGGSQPMNVEGAMKGLNRAVKALGEAATDPARKADALRLVSEAQRNCAAAKMLPLPAQYTKDAADDAAKAKIQDEYASDLRKTLRMLLDLEDAIAAGKADEAKAILGKVQEMREHAHKELGVDD